MDTILPTNETSEFEGRLYLNPQIQLDEGSNFIDNLRATQTQQNQEIAQQTHNLGTDVPSNLGGLTGAGSYFTSRYQTPQTNAAVSDLRAAAQAQALNQVLQNQQDMWRKRYNDAYRSYQKNAYDKSNSGGSGGSGGGGGNSSTWNGNVVDVPTNLSATESLTLSSDSPDDMGTGVTWTIEMGSVGTDKTVWHRVDTTKPKSDPEYETIWEQEEDGTLKRIR